MRHQVECFFQTTALHELGQCDSDQRLEHPVKVKLGQTRCRGHIFQAKRLTEVSHHVIDRAIDPLQAIV